MATNAAEIERATTRVAEALRDLFLCCARTGNAEAPRPAESLAQPAGWSGDEMLLPTEAARVMRTTPETLAKWRSAGRGPRFIKHGAGRVFYRQKDIREWADSQARVSTSDVIRRK